MVEWQTIFNQSVNYFQAIGEIFSVTGVFSSPVRLRRGLAGRVQVDLWFPVDSPAGQDDHDEDDCQQEASDGRAHHDQQGQSVWNK